MAPSRVYQLRLGELTTEDVPQSYPAQPTWMPRCEHTEHLDEFAKCSDGPVVSMLSLSGEVVWGPRTVPDCIVVGSLRNLVSQELSWPPDALTIVHSSETLELSVELSACLFGKTISLYLIKHAYQDPVAQGVRYVPSMYAVVDEVTVGSGLSTFSQDLHELPVGALVRVSVTILIEEEQRVRGHISEYILQEEDTGIVEVYPCDGWISLADTEGDAWVLEAGAVLV